MDTFGALLRRHRERRGLNQSRLAHVAGFDHSYVCRLEAGTREPSRETVLALADVLGVEGDDLDDLLAAAGYLPSPAWPVRAVLARLAMLKNGTTPPYQRDMATMADVALRSLADRLEVDG